MAIDVKTGEEHQQLQKVLGELVDRDPIVSVHTEEGSTRTILSGMDEWYLQRICERIVRDHKIKLDVGEATVIYLETIRKPAEAEGKYIRQTGGVGNYGHVKIRIEPNEADVAFVTDIKGGVVPQEYFGPIEQGIREALRGGVLGGYDIVNVKATLFDGSFHDIDSNPMAFKIAGSMALKEAARNASPIVLEPVMAVQAVTPEELMSSTVAEISRRRGRIERIEQHPNAQVIHAIVPLAEMVGADKPVWSMRFASYEPVPLRGGLGDSPANVAQPKPPTMGGGSASVRPEREFEG
jgi:elongation factor G